MTRHDDYFGAQAMEPGQVTHDDTKHRLMEVRFQAFVDFPPHLQVLSPIMNAIALSNAYETACSQKHWARDALNELHWVMCVSRSVQGDLFLSPQEQATLWMDCFDTQSHLRNAYFKRARAPVTKVTHIARTLRYRYFCRIEGHVH